MNKEPELYVGYLKTAPAGLARFVRKRIAGLLLLVATMAVVLVCAQHPFGAAYFEFGTVREFHGTVRAKPYPHLLVVQPGAADVAPTFSRYYLVAPGKKGAQALVGDLDGKTVVLSGTLIYREDQTMIEVVPGSIKETGAARAEGEIARKRLGTMVLRGEIVDSKCYLGVMNPGNLKPHRSCAVRCISGGIPPVFLVRDRAGQAVYLMLVGADGRTVNQEVLDLIAEPLEIEGEVLQEDNLLVLQADPATYKRIP